MLINSILYFSAYSFIGWVMESVFVSISGKKPVNRGFLYGPFCPIYGFGALIVLFSFRLAAVTVPSSAKLVVGALLSMLFASALEYATGVVLLKLTGRRYWDYSGHPFNLGGFICLTNSLLWGLLGLAVVQVLHPLVAGVFALASQGARAAAATALLFGFATDFALSIRAITEANLERDSALLHEEYETSVGDLLLDEHVVSMDAFVQHGDVSCLEHCRSVSYKSFLLCRAFRLDSRSAARGALLHDYFLYDWHDPHDRWHGFRHPQTALANANRDFALSPMEQDIISKHMWPLTPAPPHYPETFVVSFADKYCTVQEVMQPKVSGLNRRLRVILERS